jgi:hypothetical protein
MGCYCALQFKNWFAVVECWLHEQGLTEAGWPVELNGP